MTDLLTLIQAAKIYDLAQPYFIGMPHHPVHPPFFVSAPGANQNGPALHSCWLENRR